MSDEKNEPLCKDCEPTFQAFLEEMAAHNAEQMAELNPNPKVTCPTCGKIHEYSIPKATKPEDSTTGIGR
jgi:RNase P subunit RPR2